MKTLFSVVFLLLSVTVAAGAAGKPYSSDRTGWKDSIRVDGQTIEIRAVSAGGDVYEDDMDVTIVQGGDSLRLPLKKAWYHPARVTTDLNNLASEVAAVRIGPHEILLVLLEDARPGYPSATFVVYDYEKKTVVAVRERVAQFKMQESHTRFLLVGGGPGRYRTRLIKEKLGISDGPEDYIDAWMSLRYAGGKIESAWE